MLAAGCGDRPPTAGADRGAARTFVAVTSGDTIASMTATMTTAATSGSGTATSSTATATSSTSAPAFRERRGYRQGRDRKSEHEQTRHCHVGLPSLMSRLPLVPASRHCLPPAGPAKGRYGNDPASVMPGREGHFNCTLEEGFPSPVRQARE